MKHSFVIACGLACLLATPLLAAGPIDGEFGAIYWASEFDTTGMPAPGAISGEDSAAPGFRAEMWVFNNFGLRAGMYEVDLDMPGVETSSYSSLDLLWRPFSPTENSFLAIGLGWQEMDLSTIGLSGDTSGARLNGEARIGVGPVYFYGQGSYQPELDDAMDSNNLGGRFEDLSGVEAEIGVSWTIFPFVSLRAGYRVHDVDYTLVDPAGGRQDGEVESAGVLAGLSFHF
jgi:hypothetical protein